MSTLSITTTQNIELEYDMASVGERMVGYLLDFILIIIYILFVLLIVNILNNTGIFSGGNNNWLVLILFLPIYFYDLLCESLFNGQSLGKRIMGMKVISLDGEQPTFGQYIIRWLFRIVDFPVSSWLAGLIMVLVTEKRQRLGDLVAGTTVVKTKPRSNIFQTLYVPTEETVYNPTYPEVINLSDSDMQLVKEVLINVQRSGNTMLALQMMNKIEQVLHITGKQEPVNFLYTVLADYNNLASKL
jgi:uncharacterized RDD family membrane protein YckC